jgi:hypothetical protein
MAASRVAEERFALVAGLRLLEVFELVAGEETRSREAGENAEMTARHLVPFGAALRIGDPVGAGCGDDGDFHGPVPLALSISYSRHAGLIQ